MKRISFLCQILVLLTGFEATAQTPVAYYPFTGNANDAAGSLNGTVNGATLTADRFGDPNSAYSFDGNDFISTTNVPTNNVDNWSMLAWVQPSSINQHDGTIVLNGFDNGTFGTGYTMLMNNGSGSGPGNSLCALFNQLSYAGSGGVFNTVNIWYHVAMVRQAGVTRFYLNGFQTPSTSATTPVSPNGSLMIGSCNGNRFWQGAIDEVKIYNTGLTAAQVQQEYISSRQPLKAGSGNAINFDGVDDYVAIGPVDFAQADYTFESWFTLSGTIALTYSLLSGQEIVLTNSSLQIEIGIDNKIRFLHRNPSGNVGGVELFSNQVIVPGRLYHLTCVKTGTTLQMYINGILENSITDAAVINFTYAPIINLGFLHSGAPRYFNGIMDEVRLWNTALTQSQIRDRMCHKITASDALYPNLIAYYNFDENTGITALDGTANNYNGTLTNSPTRVTSGAAIGNASSHDYVNGTKTTTLSHPTGESFTVTSTSGNPGGIQVYRIDQQPNTLSGAPGVGANNKYFGVFQVSGASPQYTAVYNYSVNPFVTPGAESQLRLNKRGDNAATSWTTIAVSPNEVNNTITVTGENTEYILGTLGVPLPLNLLSFSGSKQNNDAVLQWNTSDEINITPYEVERSDNGNNFVTIGHVTAGRTSYSFTDPGVFNAKTVAFYRLKVNNAGGRVNYSTILKLSKQINALVTVFPNPVSDVLTITGLKQKGIISLFSAEGRLLLRQTVSAQTMTIDMRLYLKGTYLLQYEAEEQVANQKIIKH